jgi:hypothetical protein
LPYSNGVEVFSTSWIKVHGNTYKPGHIVIIASNLLPTFGKITDILIYNTDDNYLVLQKFHTICFNQHYHSFEVLCTDPIEYFVCKPIDLVDPHPLSLYNVPGSPQFNFISYKYHIIENI